MFISEAIAATATTAEATPNPMLGFVVQLVLVFSIFYFLLIRPQQKKMKEREDMLNAIKVKDEIITGGGIYAHVTKAEADVLTVEISKDVEIRVSRSSVQSVISDETKK